MGLFDFLDPTAPNAESLALVATARQRWAALYLWGLKTRAPEARVFWEEWETFDAKAKDGSISTSAITPQIINLTQAERTAKDHGFVAPPELSGIDIEKASTANKAAAAVDQGAKVVERVVVETVKAPALAIPWTKIGLIAGGGFVVVGVTGLYLASKVAPVALEVLAAQNGIALPPGHEPAR